MTAWKSFTQFLFGRKPETVPAIHAEAPIPKRRTDSENHRDLEHALAKNTAAAETITGQKTLAQMMEEEVHAK